LYTALYIPLALVPSPVYSWRMDEEMKYLHLNFSHIFVDRLRAYADRHGMKLNAVLKKAFELLEDSEAKKGQQSSAPEGNPW
jgi:hypothetical protein